MHANKFNTPLGGDTSTLLHINQIFFLIRFSVGRTSSGSRTNRSELHISVTSAPLQNQILDFDTLCLHSQADFLARVPQKESCAKTGSDVTECIHRSTEMISRFVPALHTIPLPARDNPDDPTHSKTLIG